MNDEHKRLILIFSIALSLRLFLFFNVGSWNDEIVEKRIVVDDAIFIFLFIVHVYFLVRFLKQDNNWDLIYSGIFLGLSTLCRPVSVYFFIFIVGIFFLYFRKNLRIGILRYAILVSAFLITIIPWIARNYTVSGKFLVSSVQVKVLRWNMPRLIKLKVVYQQKDEINNSSPSLSKIRNSHQKMLTKKNIINAALSDIKRYITGIIRFFMQPGSSGYPDILGLKNSRLNVNAIWEEGPWETVKIVIQEKSVLEMVLMCFILSFLTILYFTMCLGIYTAIKETKFIDVFLFIIIIVYFAIASSPFTGDPRYRAPIMPFIILLSCYGIIQLHIRFNEYKIKRMTTMSKI